MQQGSGPAWHACTKCFQVRSREGGVRSPGPLTIAALRCRRGPGTHCASALRRALLSCCGPCTTVQAGALRHTLRCDEERLYVAAMYGSHDRTCSCPHHLWWFLRRCKQACMQDKPRSVHVCARAETHARTTSLQHAMTLMMAHAIQPGGPGAAFGERPEAGSQAVRQSRI